MKTSSRLFVVAVLFAASVVLWSGFGSVAQEKGKEAKDQKGKEAVLPQSAKWEYKVTVHGDNNPADEKDMNRLGDDGWELVATTSSVSADPRPQGTNRISTQVRLIFKRPKK